MRPHLATLVLLGTPLALLGTLVPGPARALDADRYAAILERFTREVADAAGTRVDYPGLAREPEWRRLVEQLAGDEPGSMDENERMAFWLNAYNVLAIDLVVRNQPLDSIRDIGSLFSPVWKRTAGRAAGRAVTLHEIEHEILRPLGDPRIHAAIVCASTSCPSLRRDPYRSAQLDDQLDDALRRFLADPRKGSRLEASAGVLRLSKIFDWFAEDFESGGGVIGTLAPYLPESTRRWLEASETPPTLRYFDYDWSLNAIQPL